MWTALWIFLSAVAVAFIAPMIAHAIKLAEFRQGWINELRKDIADYLGLARRWARKYVEFVKLEANNPTQAALEAKMDEVASLLNEARVIQWRIQMRINPRENQSKQQDDQFLKALANVTDFDRISPYDPNAHDRFNILAGEAVSESRNLLKREWDVTKQFVPQWVIKAYHAVTGM